MTDSARTPVANARLGVAAGLLAYGLWGVFPVYFKVVEHVAPSELLMHQVVWAVPFGALIVLLRRQAGAVWAAFRTPATLAWLALAAACIAGNWLVYIWAVLNERILETSLGYYINPLVYVLVGVAFFSERLTRLQVAAVAIAGIGVAILTLSLGAFPWVSLSLAVLFTAYGVIRKRIAIGAMPGLFVETLLMLPFAVAWLLLLDVSGRIAFGSGDADLDLLLVFAGPATVLPLLFFATAARNVTLTTLGFMQYIAPTLQFLIALAYGEPLTPGRAACFACIWIAVLLFTVDAIRRNKKKPPAVATAWG